MGKYILSICILKIKYAMAWGLLDNHRIVVFAADGFAGSVMEGKTILTRPAGWTAMRRD
jgi:hypothetical protein